MKWGRELRCGPGCLGLSFQSSELPLETSQVSPGLEHFHLEEGKAEGSAESVHVRQESSLHREFLSPSLTERTGWQQPQGGMKMLSAGEPAPSPGFRPRMPPHPTTCSVRAPPRFSPFQGTAIHLPSEPTSSGSPGGLVPQQMGRRGLGRGEKHTPLPSFIQSETSLLSKS